MIFGLAALAVLVTWLLRDRFAGRPSAWSPAKGARAEWAVATLGTLAMSGPLLLAVPRLVRPDVTLIGDASSHAVIAHAIARDGLPHGWIDSFNGGFPVALHYPVVGWLLAAGLMKLHVPPVSAMQGLALFALLAAPLVALFGARAAGARPLAAFAGAAALAWVSPHGGFVGGWEAYLQKGLFSQVLSWPLVPWLVAAVARSRRAHHAPLVAALLLATHPQVGIATLVALLPAVLASGSRDALLRLVRAGVAGGAVLVAEFGPGLRTLGVPFGWPPMDPWKIVGFRPEQTVRWILDARLLDEDREPVLALAWLLAVTVLLACVRRRSCRATLAATVTVVAVALSGTSLARAGKLGALVLSFLQPLRVLPLVPVVVAAALVVAVEEILASAAAAAWRLRVSPSLLARAAVLSLLGVGAFDALRSRELFMEDYFARTVVDATHPECGERHPDLVVGPTRGWIRDLRGGRIDLYGPPPFAHCAFRRGVAFDSPLPFAGTAGAGAHVGVHSVAFSQLRPTEPGSAARAEALGVRWVLTETALRPGPASDWRVLRSGGGEELSERLGGTDTIGVGCVSRAWRGDDPALRAALFDDLGGAATLLADPRALTRIERDAGELVVADEPRRDCDASRASVVESAREPGAYEASVESPSPVDVVARATSFPSWRAEIDGREAPTFVVAPGFPAVRVPSGRHHVVFVVSLPRFYLAGLGVALFVVALSCRARPFSRPDLGRLRGAVRRGGEGAAR